MIIKENEFWKYFYQNENADRVDIPNCGKWMYFFKLKDWELVDNIILKAMELGICKVIKRSVNLNKIKTIKQEIWKNQEGVVCFYLSIDDIASHKNVIQFFLDNDLIKTTKTGKLYNISFKLDEQTYSLEYSSNGKFKAKLTLSDILDLETREWKV